MGRTIEVAKAFKNNNQKTVMPTEQARGIWVERSPSAEALKVLNLMIDTAGGRMGGDVSHTLRLSAIKKIEGMRNQTQSSITSIFGQLHAMTYHFDDKVKKIHKITNLMDETDVKYSAEFGGDLVVEWRFTRGFQRMAATSDHWAILDRQAMFSFKSKYSILLFQHLSTYFNLDHFHFKRFTLEELRSVLNMPEGKNERFAQLNQNVLKPAIAEINQLSRFEIWMKTIKVNRSIGKIDFTWDEKEDLSPTKRELNASKTGRKARRKGSAELIVPPFPDCGGLSATAEIDQHWRGLFEENVSRVQGNNLPDSKQVCDAFRKARGDRLDGTDTERHFVNFCKRWQG